MSDFKSVAMTGSFITLRFKTFINIVKHVASEFANMIEISCRGFLVALLHEFSKFSKPPFSFRFNQQAQRRVPEKTGF